MRCTWTCDMTEEQYLREKLVILHKQYLKDAQPYIDRLTRIMAMRPPPPMYMTFLDAARADIKKAEENT